MSVLDGLNPEQRRAAEAVRGPVCILAGAGSGKTTTITRRIAWQVASGAFRAGEILAVTFTDKAAGVMKARLAALGAGGVEARTFHSAALGQLHRYSPGSVGRILPTKALLLRQIANALPRPYRFRPAGDLATEIERAKNLRVRPERYLAALGEHDAADPGRPDGDRVYREYERRKASRGELDFEDVLELAVRLYETDEHARAEVRERYRAFTVDEYQDVNLLQQALLDQWLGPRDDLCVVGDDYQSIYAFTGASPRLAARHARAVPVRDRRAPRGELPLVAGGARAREPARAAARRRGEGAARDAAARAGAGRALVRHGRVRGRVARARAEAARGARASRSRRPRSSAARTRGWPTSRRCCTRPGFRSRARRSSGARRRGGCSGCSRAWSRRTSRAAFGCSPSRPAGSRSRPTGSASAS